LKTAIDETQHSLWDRLMDGSGADGAWRKERWHLLRAGRWPTNHAWQGFGWLWRMQAEIESDDGKAIKWRLESQEHRDACETVLLLPRPSRATVCISSQIGCAVGCTFCATGRMGLVRQLTTNEILEQVLWARMQLHTRTSHASRRIHLRNVVFMGMGEPLHNDASVHDAIAYLIADQGFGFSPRHITLSTVGIPSKMVETARRFPRLRIALSLHAADSELRRRLVPRATHDLESLRGAIQEINAIDREGPVWIEYALIAGVNDSLEHAEGLAEFCRELRVEINVIPYNPSAAEGERYQAPELAVQDAFVGSLRDRGIFTTLRNSLGRSIQAACGQLIAPTTTVSAG